MLSRQGSAKQKLTLTQRQLGCPEVVSTRDNDTRSIGLVDAYGRRLVNAYAFTQLGYKQHRDGGLKPDQKERLLTSSDIVVMAEIEGILCLTRPLITLVQHEKLVADSFALLFMAVAAKRLENNPDGLTSKGFIKYVDLNMKPTKSTTLRNVRRVSKKYEDLNPEGKQAWDRALFAFTRWFPEWPVDLTLAAFLDPRTRGKLKHIVTEGDLVKARSACLAAFKSVLRSTYEAEEKLSRASEEKETGVNEGGRQPGEASSSGENEDEQMDEFDLFSSIDESLTQQVLESHSPPDIDTRVNTEAVIQMGVFLDTHYNVNDVKNRIKGQEDAKLGSMEDVFTATQVESWVVNLKETQAAAFKVCMLNLGQVTASSFLERFFSTCKQVWNSGNSNTKMDKVEKKAILRHNAALMCELRKKARKV